MLPQYFKLCYTQDFEGGPQQGIRGAFIDDVRCVSCGLSIYNTSDCGQCAFCEAYVHEFLSSVCRTFSRDHKNGGRLFVACIECSVDDDN